MFKSYHKLILSAIASFALASSLIADGSHRYPNGKKVIDGGVTYPVKHGMTSVYHVNEKALKGGFNLGRVATANEIKAWDIDVMPDGTGLPEGKGTVEEGEEIYEAKCMACHFDFGAGGDGYPALAKGNAYEMHQTLKYQRTDPDKDGPVRVFGSYWPKVSTLWWYIKTGMPHNAPMSLSDDEVYALVAYIASLNELKFIDGTEIEEDTEINKDNILKIDLPNKNGFIPNIEGKNGLENVRKFYNNPNNYGNGKRCMHHCFKGEPKIQRIVVDMATTAMPPISTKRDLPKKKAGNNDAKYKELYASKCAMCHDSGAAGAPILGDKKAWKARIDAGMETLYKNGIDGKGAMPPKGGAGGLSDDEFKKIVDYIVNKSK